jgi:hypothetical protein
MGFNGWKHSASLRFVHLGIRFLSPLMVTQWVILIFLDLVFTSALWLLTGEPRGLYRACVKYHYQAKLEPHSSVIASPVTGFHHSVRGISCGALYIHRWSHKFSP